MFLNRLSTALLALTCFGGFVLGANPERVPDANHTTEVNLYAAPLAVDFDLNQNQPTCSDDGDGKIIVNITVGTGPFKVEYKTTANTSYTTFTASTNATSITIDNSFTPIVAATYDVRVTDLSQSTNNSAVRQITVSDFPVLTLDYTINTINCSTDNGIITLQANGGDATNYTYTIKNSTGTVIQPDVNGGNVFSGLNQGNYTARVIDNNGCSFSESGLEIAIPEAINPTVNVTPITCFDETATITITGLPSNSASYQILLDGTVSGNITGTTATISNVSEGSHDLKVTRPNCSSDDWTSPAIVVDQYDPISFFWGPDDPNDLYIGCGQDTSLSVAISGGKIDQNYKMELFDVNETAAIYTQTVIAGQVISLPNILPNVQYTLIATDVSNPDCASNAFNFAVSGPTVPFEILDVIVTDATCNGFLNGTAKIISSGGTAPFTYSTDNGLTFTNNLPADKIITGLAGNKSYNIALKDAYGCISNAYLISVGEPDPITVSFISSQTQQLSCPGADNGQLVAVATGGTKPYFYALQRGDGSYVAPYSNFQGADTVAFANLEADTYTVTVFSAVCAVSETDVATINSIPEVNLEINFDPIICHNDPLDIQANASGGDGSAFTYKLINTTTNTEVPQSPKTESIPGTGVVFTDVLPGNNYRIEASYGSCDPVTIDTLIINPKEFVLTIEDTVSVACFGDNADALIVSNGENPSYYSMDGVNYTMFNQNPGGTATRVSGLTAGATNAVYFRDKNNCVYNNGSPVVIYVDEPDEIGLSLVTNDPKVSCTGASDAQVTLQVTGGTPAFQVEIDVAGTTKSKATDSNGLVTFNLPAGTFSVDVTDIDKACSMTFTDAVTVVEPANPFALDVAIDVPALSCFGDSTRVEATTSGGWGGDAVIHVTGGSISKDLPANGVVYLKAGTYNFTALSADGCQATQSNVVISQPKKLVLNIINSHNVSCNGAEDADISIGVSGGTLPYYWGVNGVATIDADHQFDTNSIKITNDMVPLPEGSYDLIVQDENGCVSNVKQVSIQEPDPITFEFVADSFVTCNGASDGKITITNVSGGSTIGYKSLYSLSDGPEVPGNMIIDGLASGNYSVRVANVNDQCFSDPQNITIYDPAEIQIINVAHENIKCYGVPEGSITIDAEGGQPYSLQYRITNGGSFDSGYSTNNEFTDLQPGSYTAWVRNSAGNCETQYPQVIEIENVLELTLPDESVVVSDVSCHNAQDGSVELNASGGTGTLTYTLTNALATVANNPNNSGEFTGLGDQNKSSTTYTYRVQDINQCFIEGSFTVANPPQLTIDLVDKTDVVCHNGKDGTITVSVTGGTGAYTLSDMNLPSLNYTIENVSADEFKITTLGTTQLSTLYLPAVTDENGCVEVLPNEIEIINPLQVRVDSVTWGDKQCYGDNSDSTIIHASGGTGHFYYSLDDGANLSLLNDSIFIGEDTGTKFAFVMDENGCFARADSSYEYIQPEPLNIRYEFDPILCYTDTFANMRLEIVGGTGPYHLSINYPNFSDVVYDIYPENTDTTRFDLKKNSIPLIEDTKYKFYLRDDNNCAVDNVPDVDVYSQPFADTIFTKPEELVLISDSLKAFPVRCSASQTGLIKFAAKGGTVTASNGYTLTAVNVARDFPSTNAPFSNYVEDLFSGLHHVYLTDANGCVGRTRFTDAGWDYDTITVDYENKSLKVNVSDIIQPTCDDTYDGELEVDVEDFYQDGATAYVYYQDSVLGTYGMFDEADTIAATLPFINDNLYYRNNQKIAIGMGYGQYQIKVMDNYTFCVDSIDLTIFSVNGDSCPPTYYYNVFTPNNGDDYNENWTVFGSQHQTYTLQIYTSWGELIYSDEGTADGDGVKWNGVDQRGNPVPVGTYIYLLQKNKGTPRDTLINGNVTVIRGDGRW